VRASPSNEGGGGAAAARVAGRQVTNCNAHNACLDLRTLISLAVPLVRSEHPQMGKGGARLVTTRSRCFSVIEREGGEGSSSLTQRLSSGGGGGGGGGESLSEPLGGGELSEEEARLSRAQRAKVFVAERGNAYIYLACALSFIPASFGFMPVYIEYYTPSVWAVRARRCRHCLVRTHPPAAELHLTDQGAHRRLALQFIIGSVGFAWVAGCDAQETWKLHASGEHGSELPQFYNCLLYLFGSALYFFWLDSLPPRAPDRRHRDGREHPGADSRPLPTCSTASCLHTHESD
jgi:hypothetical protein